ncbi:metallophosphoesterase family protein [Mucilaginibacter sp. AW1-3]
MKIALFSDIHANLPALTTVLNDIDSRKPDAIYCLGDLVGYNVWPNEVIAAIRDKGIPTIAGNHDIKVSNLNAVDKHGLDQSGKNYAYHIINAQHREYLQSLPVHIRVEFRLNNELINLLLVHGSPRSIDEYLFEDMPEDDISTMMKEVNADILCFGHTHKPYHRIINVSQNGTTHYRHAINLGSIGKPKDNDNRACYVILNIDKKTNITDPSTVSVEFIRVVYGVEEAAIAIENSPLPNEFADMLRKAY